MPLFIYTTIKVVDNKVCEEDGMVYGSDKDGAIRYLSSLGYVIRDMREASRDDIRLARLKAFRANFNQSKIPPLKNVSSVRRVKWEYLVLFLIVLGGLLIWRLL